MANATSLTVNTLSGNGFGTEPAGDVFDTGTTTVTLNAAVGGLTDKLLLRYANGGTVATTVTIKAGQSFPTGPAFRAGLGDLSGSVGAGAVGVFGPLESARFVKSDGSIDVTFAPIGAAGTARLFKLPVE